MPIGLMDYAHPMDRLTQSWLRILLFAGLFLAFACVFEILLATAVYSRKPTVFALAGVLPFVLFSSLVGIAVMVQIFNRVAADYKASESFSTTPEQVDAITQIYREISQRGGRAAFESECERRIKQLRKKGIDLIVQRDGPTRTILVPKELVRSNPSRASSISHFLAELCAIMAGTGCESLVLAMPDFPPKRADRVKGFISRVRAFLAAVEDVVVDGAKASLRLILLVSRLLVEFFKDLGFVVVDSSLPGSEKVCVEAT